MAVCNVNELLADAGCLQCLTPGQLELIIAQLLCNISVDGGGGGSSGCIPPAAGNPEGVVTANPGCTYLNLTDSSFWVKRTGSGNTGWQALIV